MVAASAVENKLKNKKKIFLENQIQNNDDISTKKKNNNKYNKLR